MFISFMSGSREVRLLAEAPREHVIDMLGDVTAPAVADPDERGKLAYLLAWLRARDRRLHQRSY